MLKNLWEKEELTRMHLKDETWFQVYKTLGFHCVCYLVRVSCDDL